jgi:hypothetical protein
MRQALRAECLVVALGGCSLFVAANIYAKGYRPQRPPIYRITGHYL